MVLTLLVGIISLREMFVGRKSISRSCASTLPLARDDEWQTNAGYRILSPLYLVFDYFSRKIQKLKTSSSDFSMLFS